MTWKSTVSWFGQRIPLIGLVGYTMLRWRFVLGSCLLMFVVYSVLKNLMSVITNKNLCKSSFVLLVFFDIWTSLFKFCDFFCLDLYYSRALLNGILRLGKSCPTTTLKVETVDEHSQAYVYTPATISNRGCVMYIHGGGFAFLSAYGYNSNISWMAHYLEMVVVSVEYRLAPENPFPAGLTDCYSTLQWIYDNKSALDIDTDKVFVCGDSAGGNLAAALCLLHRDRSGRALDAEEGPTHSPLAGQILFYPLLQGFNFKSGSMAENSPLFPSDGDTSKLVSFYTLGNDKLMKYVGVPEVIGKPPKFWGVVNNILVEDDEMLKSAPSMEKCVPGASAFENPYVFPLHSTDLSGLPPAYIIGAAGDPLRDEGVWYSEYLRHFKVAADLKIVKTCHGFMGQYDQNELARNALEEVNVFIKDIISA